MTEGQKKLAIIGTVILVVLFFLTSSKGVGSTIINQSNRQPIDANIPSVDIPRGNITINVPGLPSFTPYQFSPISPCMCNGAEVTSMNNPQGPLVTFITNQGSSGPNIYNYTPPKPPYYGAVGMG
jgi:hypothetical protein